MQISFVGDHQIFSLLSPFQQAEREREEKNTTKTLKGFFFLTHPCFVLVRPHSMHQFSVTPSPASFLSASLSLTLYPSLAHFCFGLSFSLTPSLSRNLCVGLKFKFKFKQLHWHDKRESGPGSFSVPAPPQSDAPWPSNLWSGLEYGLYDVEEGQPSFCVGSDLWTATLWACQRCIGVRDSSDRVSLFGRTQTTTVL